MKAGYTHITIILDRTGSMASIRDDTIGGFNTFLREQMAGPGEAALTRPGRAEVLSGGRAVA